jgi:tetratricopeptide (TPR) repeat protein
MIALAKENCYESSWDAAYSLLSNALEFPKAQEDKQFRAKVLKTMGRYWYYRGEWKESRRVIEEGLKLRQEHFGLDSPDTASLLGCLGSVLIHEKRFDRAEELFRQAIQLRENAVWDRDYGMVHHLSGLACAVGKQGRFNEAKSAYRRALKMQEKWQGGDPLVKAWILNSLAAVCVMDRSFQEGKDFLTRALNIRRQCCSLTEPECQDTIRQLVSLYQVSGDYANAMAMSHMLLPDHRTALPLFARIIMKANDLLGVFVAEMYLADGMDTFMKQRVVLNYETSHSMRRWVIFPLWKVIQNNGPAQLTLIMTLVPILLFYFVRSIMKLCFK